MSFKRVKIIFSEAGSKTCNFKQFLEQEKTPTGCFLIGIFCAKNVCDFCLNYSKLIRVNSNRRLQQTVHEMKKTQNVSLQHFFLWVFKFLKIQYFTCMLSLSLSVTLSLFLTLYVFLLLSLSLLLSFCFFPLSYFLSISFS